MQQEPIELKKRLEEVRLLESRRSARLADQERDTDFARLADMGGDRRRTSHSIEVPLSLTPQHNSSRKRPPSYAHECSSDQCNEEEMNECNAAMILVTLSNSPKSPKNADKWFGSSPGSSSASWSSGSSSPPLSDDGHVVNALLHGASASARIRTTSVSTSDEGIVVDFKEDAPRKKRASRSRFICTWKGCNFVEHTPPKIERHIRIVHLGIKKPRRSTEYADGSVSDSDHEEEFYYTEVEDDDDEGKTPSPTSPPTLSHRDMARPPHEDPEYQRQIVGTFKQGRAASLQMQQQQQQQQQQHSGARATHHSNSTHISSSHQQQSQISNASQIPTSPLAHHNYTWPAESGPTFAAIIPTPTSTTAHYHQQQQQSSSAAATALVKHARASPRPSHCTGPYPSPAHVHQHHNYSSPAAHNGGGGGGSSSTHSPIVHSNNPSSVLQQLSQQNITVTAHHSGGTQQQQHQQQQQQQQQQSLAMVTITPNFAHNSSHRSHQHHGRGGSGQREHLHHQQLQQHSPTTTTASSSMAASATARMPPQHHHQHVAVQHAIAAAKHTPNSPNRRTRGENKKCRKVYGMERRDMWCTQCRWKKACSRFGD